MNIEFHYYITYLIAARAGLRNDDLRVLAYSSQFTDDNKQGYKIKGPRRGQKIFRGRYYHNLISQTMDIFKPHDDRLNVYPLFHFIPGEKMHPAAQREDGRIRPFNTTPNSRNANFIIDEAIASGNLYMLGMASHAYVDTWAHQNFVGYKDLFNGMSGFINKALPDIGHADARHNPDWPALVWQDSRLSNPLVDNRVRFLDAAEHLFRKIRGFADASCSEAALLSDARALRDDLDVAIGERDDTNRLMDARIERYKNLATQPAYGGMEIPEYNRREWFNASVNTYRQVGVQRRVGSRHRISYRFRGAFQNSDWFRFQQAVKNYVEIASGVLKESFDFARDTDWKRYDAYWRE